MRIKKLIYFVLFIVGVYILRGCGLIWIPYSRYDQLKSVVSRHVGYAHMTRGMNANTIEALKREVTAADLPLLAKMLNDHDVVAAMTAANVLGGMGEEGRKILRNEREELNRNYNPSRGMVYSAVVETIMSIQKEWLACESDTDCTSITMGCSYWQPVNKQYIEQMKSARTMDCISTTKEGPQPASGCVNRVCANILVP